MGKKENREMLFWTKEEYLKFANAMMDKPLSFYAFEMLYWCGIREGELLVLTPADFDFEKGAVSINKSYHQYKTTPTKEQREQARREYLDRRGVPESYHWTTSPWEL